jgi:hypothetical protein
MSRLVLLFSTLALLAAACSGTTAEEATDTGAVDNISVEGSSSTPVPGESSATSEPSTEQSASESANSSADKRPLPEGPAAPDFSLALEPSGEFVLSQEVKPVYMIFWAEW